MTPDSKRFLHPEAIRRIGRLELRARHIVEGLQTGMHRSPYFGQSVEFLQHRQYVPGDDLRHVDWKVWAKQDRLYVKQFEEETNMRCTMLVDVSASMQYGNGPLNKYEYAATVATSLAYLLLKQHDSVACIAFDDHIRARSPLNSSQKHLHVDRPNPGCEQARPEDRRRGGAAGNCGEQSSARNDGRRLRFVGGRSVNLAGLATVATAGARRTGAAHHG